MGWDVFLDNNMVGKAVAYLDTIIFDNHVTIDLRECCFSYELSSFIYAVIQILSKNSGEKQITIKHGFSTISESHFATYINKCNKAAYHNLKSIAEINKSLFDNYEIHLNIEETIDE